MAKNNFKEHIRERIINSAKKLFAEQGYQKTAIVDISRIDFIACLRIWKAYFL